MTNNPRFVGPPRRRPINGSSQRRAIDRVVAAIEPPAVPTVVPDTREARREQKAAVSAWEDEGGSIAAPKQTQRR